MTTTQDTLYIVSGEGTQGTREIYAGKRTARAIKARLTRERCSGDRWARVEDEEGREVNPDYYAPEV
jgi:hypothetical protein